jgi:ABC-2 type transport system permease protein
MLGDEQLLVEARPRVLFNPDTRTPNFFIPGLIVVLTYFMALIFSSTSIVREKEKQTLDQLFLTPLSSQEVILGKVMPYLALICVEFGLLVFFMRSTFDVPIQGNLAVLMVMTIPFVLTSLSIGLLISMVSTTQLAAIQVCSGMLVPAIFLSGYVFPLDSMPRFFWYIAYALPTTWMIDATRGVILRGAGWVELQVHFAVLSLTAFVMLALSALVFAQTRRLPSRSGDPIGSA